MTGHQIGDAIQQRVDEMMGNHVHTDGRCNCNEITAALVEHEIVEKAIGCMIGSLGPVRGMAIVLSTAFEAGYEYALRELGGRKLG